MRILCACSSYWNTQAEADARYNGVCLNLVDPLTGNVAYPIHPEYAGRLAIKPWYENMQRLFHPVHTFVACGTYSNPAFSRLPPEVAIVNSGVFPERPHTNGWQYMACALTMTMAHALDWGDWDVLLAIEPDILLGNVDWDALLREFLARPEEVFGATWYDIHCDMMGYKRRGAARFLHQRTRPNLTEDESVPWLDHEMAAMFKGRAWNPWPEMRTYRQDFFHPPSVHPSNEEAMRWPMVRMPDPSLIDEYLRTQSSLAKPVQLE